MACTCGSCDIGDASWDSGFLLAIFDRSSTIVVNDGAGDSALAMPTSSAGMPAERRVVVEPFSKMSLSAP